MSTSSEVPLLPRHRIGRRAFLKLCAALASALALAPAAAANLAAGLRDAGRHPVLWLSFQECTGCTESLTRSHAPTLEALLFEAIDLAYHHTLQAAAGDTAEAAREAVLQRFPGRYLVVVEGSVPVAGAGFSTIAGRDDLTLLRECLEGAAGVIAVGTCAAFGGLAGAQPNPTGAVGVGALIESGLVPRRPLRNVPGCPPLPLAIAGVLVHFVAFGRFPDCDALGRPLAFYGETVHQRCGRYAHFRAGRFAERFDDAGARSGWCLYRLGCRGPETHNACATQRWNQGVSWPVHSGHPCLGCSEPGFWDRGGLYRPPIEPSGGVRPDPVATDVPDAHGHALYQENCAFCHSPDGGGFATAPADLPELMRAGSVRAHRRFDFADGELADLAAYLAGQRGGP